jgi:integrase
LRFGDPAPATAPAIPTVAELIVAFLKRQEARVDPATVETTRWRLKHATMRFGDRPIDSLQPYELDVWRSTLPAPVGALHLPRVQTGTRVRRLHGAARAQPIGRIGNVRASADRREQRLFVSWEEVDAIAAEMPARFAAIPIVLVGTGLRPEELLALERRDIDLAVGVLSVERVHTQRLMKDCRKSSRQRRRFR